jgi:energy-coupling factor transporter ATP-binding protein EcfA2
MLIVFVGPDGCGKTTVANAVVKYLTLKSVHEVRFFEMNFGILPRFRDIASTFLRRPVGVYHTPGEFMGGMNNSPNSVFRGGIYVLWYSLDYMLGGFFYRKLIRNEAVVFARYAYDYGYQRSFSRLPSIFHRFIISVSPKPDFIFTIERNAYDIFRDKPELDVGEISNQQQRIVSMLSNNPNFYVLDGNLGKKATIERAISIIKGARES